MVSMEKLIEAMRTIKSHCASQKHLSNKDLENNYKIMQLYKPAISGTNKKLQTTQLRTLSSITTRWSLPKCCSVMDKVV